MLDHLGQNEAAKHILGAIELVIRDSDLKTPDMGGNASTREMSEIIVQAVQA